MINKIDNRLAKLTKKTERKKQRERKRLSLLKSGMKEEK